MPVWLVHSFHLKRRVNTTRVKTIKKKHEYGYHSTKSCEPEMESVIVSRRGTNITPSESESSNNAIRPNKTLGTNKVSTGQ